tara:strand:+ start:15628 stop:17025 length:1398 start_codon:yes stop_codon:yes gene_type:complete
MSAMIQMLEQQKAQRQARFYEDYTNMMLRSTENVGTFGWDGSDLSFNKGYGVGELSAEWNRFSKAAQSRGIRPSYAQFLQMHNTAKKMELENFGIEWQKMRNRGVPDSKIRKLARKDSSFNAQLQSLGTSKLLTPEQQGGFMSFIADEGPSQMATDWSEGNLPTDLMGPAAGIGTAAMYFGRPLGNVEEARAGVAEAYDTYENLESERLKGQKDANKAIADHKKIKAKADKKFKEVSTKKYKKAPKGKGNVLVKTGRRKGMLKTSSPMYKKAMNAANEASEKADALAKAKLKFKNVSSADKLVEASKSLDKAKRTRYRTWMDAPKGGWRAGAAVGASVGARLAGGAIGKYMGGTDGAQALGADISGVAADIGVGGSQLVRALKSPSVQKEALKISARATGDKVLNKQASKSLTKAVLKALGKGATRQVAGSSMPMIGNLVMAALTIRDIADIYSSYKAGDYEGAF